MRQNAAGVVPLDRTVAAKAILDRFPGGASGPTLPPRLDALFGQDRSHLGGDLRFMAVPSVSPNPWTAIGPSNFTGHIQGIVVQPGGVLYAAGASAGVWKSIDAGKTWKPLTDFIPSLQVSRLAADPANPSRIYAATGYFSDATLPDGTSRGAGIFVTNDGGTTWTQLSSTTTSDFFVVTQLLVSPTNSNVLYASTKTGIFRSADQGLHWTAVAAKAEGYVEMAVYNNAGTDNVFAWGFGDTLYRSTNGGLTFSALAGGIPASQAYGNIAIVKPATPGQSPHIYCSVADFTQNFLGFFDSTDNGTTWTQKTLLDTSRQGRLDTLLFNNALFDEDLNGTGIDECTGNPPLSLAQGFYDNILFVDPTNPLRIWLGAVDLWRSDDGGTTWGLASYWFKDNPVQLDPHGMHADFHAFAFDPGYNGTTNQTLYLGNDGGVFRTDNSEGTVLTITVNATPTCGDPPNMDQTYMPLISGFTADQFFHGAVSADGTLLVGGLQDQGSMSFNTTATTTAWTSLEGGDGSHCAIDQTNNAVFYIQNANPSLIEKTTDGGVTFASVTNGITESVGDFAFFAPFAMDPSSSQRLWIAGQDVFRTVDGAQNWVTVSPTLTSVPIDAIAIAPSSAGQIVYVASQAGDVFRTGNALDASPVWVQINNNLPAGFISSVAVHPTNPNQVYVTYSGFDIPGGQVFRTLDATHGVTTTWSPLIGSGSAVIPNIPVYTLKFAPGDANLLLAGTELGVLASADAGATWNNVNAGTLANVPVTDFAFNGNNRVFVFTFGRGVLSASLKEPVLTITAPAPGQAIAPGSTALVSWAVNTNIPLEADIATFNVSLSTDGGATFTLLASALSASTRSFMWSVPGSLESFNVVLRVSALDASGAILGFDDVSPRIFTDTTESSSSAGGCAAATHRAAGSRPACPGGLTLVSLVLCAVAARRRFRSGRARH